MAPLSQVTKLGNGNLLNIMPLNITDDEGKHAVCSSVIVLLNSISALVYPLILYNWLYPCMWTIHVHNFNLSLFFFQTISYFSSFCFLLKQTGVMQQAHRRSQFHPSINTHRQLLRGSVLLRSQLRRSTWTIGELPETCIYTYTHLCRPLAQNIFMLTSN